MALVRRKASVSHFCAPGGLVHCPASRQGLQRGLLDLDVQQAQRVEAQLPVGGDAVIEAVRPPRLREKDDGHRLHRTDGSKTLGLTDLAIALKNMMEPACIRSERGGQAPCPPLGSC